MRLARRGRVRRGMTCDQRWAHGGTVQHDEGQDVAPADVACLAVLRLGADLGDEYSDTGSEDDRARDLCAPDVRLLCPEVLCHGAFTV